MYMYCLTCSTLTRIDEPYPMLVLCGPPGSGKGYFCKLLVEEFPSFFGLGYVHMMYMYIVHVHGWIAVELCVFN